MPRTSTDPAPLSDIARQVAECYAVVHPKRPSRSKAMQWINRARKVTSGAKGLVPAEMGAAIEELVAAGVLAALSVLAAAQSTQAAKRFW